MAAAAPRAPNMPVPKPGHGVGPAPFPLLRDLAVPVDVRTAVPLPPEPPAAVGVGQSLVQGRALVKGVGAPLPVAVAVPLTAKAGGWVPRAGSGRRAGASGESTSPMMCTTPLATRMSGCTTWAASTYRLFPARVTCSGRLATVLRLVPLRSVGDGMTACGTMWYWRMRASESLSSPVRADPTRWKAALDGAKMVTLAESANCDTRSASYSAPRKAVRSRG